jgi:signal peptidase I
MFPGLVQLHCGKAAKGIILLLLLNLVVLSGVFLVLTFLGFKIWILVYSILCLYITLDAVRVSLANNGIKLGRFSRNVVSIIFIIASLTLSNLSSEFLKTKIDTYKVSSSAMKPTLFAEDYILAKKEYSLPVRGDIVVFALPEPLQNENSTSETFAIKRIIGLPGETIEVRGNQVIIDGKVLHEESAKWDLIRVENFGPKKIPENTLFLLGDNRDNSRDSRFWNEPFLPFQKVVGKALYVYWSELNNRIGLDLLNHDSIYLDPKAAPKTKSNVTENDEAEENKVNEDTTAESCKPSSPSDNYCISEECFAKRRECETFQCESDKFAPIATAILVDKSRSMKRDHAMEKVKAAVVESIELSGDNNLISLTAFDSSHFIIIHPCVGKYVKTIVKQRISNVLYAGGKSNITSGIEHVASQLLKLNAANKNIVIITDDLSNSGDDIISTLKEVSSLIKDNGISITFISVVPKQSNSTENLTKKVSKALNASFYEVTSEKNLKKLLNASVK